MQPTEHMNPAEDELIAHIRGSLQGHEESYAPGAWENFNKEERKRPVLGLWSLSSAAAVLILFGLVFLWNTKKMDKPARHDQPAVEELVRARGTEGKVIPRAENNSLIESVAVGQQAKVILKKITLFPLSLKDGPVEVLSTSTADTAAVGSVASVIAKDPVAVNVPSTTVREQQNISGNKEKVSIEDFLEKESLRNASVKPSAQRRADKWELGIMVSPSVGNDKKLNMGYGLSMAYALSDKMSLSSGLSYNEMGADRGTNSSANMPQDSPAGAVALASTSRQLQSVQTRLRGIDVPLEFRYKFSQKLYANAGVSVFAVFKQDQQNTFVQQSVESAASYGLEGDDKSAFSQVMVNRVVSEEAPKEELSKMPYMGFYNFSFGFRQPISKKNAIAIEPFLKVPMRQAAEDNLKLVGTGLKLRFDF